MDDNKPLQEKIIAGTDSLKDLAIYLSGVKDGKGNLLPLGTVVLDDLWNAIKYLQGDVRYTLKKEKKEMETIAVWFSCGAASAVAAKLTVEKYGETHNILIVNNPIKEEDPDNIRFKNDVEKWIGQEIIEATNKDYPNASIVEIFEKRKYMSGIAGAPCTMLLKKEARYQFELTHEIDWHVLGFTVDETHRHERFIKGERANTIPVLIDAGYTKTMCFDALIMAGIKLPAMYDNYENANCPGCVKATSPTYWNTVRVVHPEVFEDRAEQSDRLGVKLVRYKGKRISLKDLPKNAKGGKIQTYECGIFCDSY